MATNFKELAATLKYLGAKWLPEKKLIFRPAFVIKFDNNMVYSLPLCFKIGLS